MGGAADRTGANLTLRTPLIVKFHEALASPTVEREKAAGHGIRTRNTPPNPCRIARLSIRPAALLTAAALAGCGAPGSYMGVDLRAQPATYVDGRLQLLAARAQAGDAATQLTLGRVFETGAGVPTDLDRACRLYRAAAATTGGTIYVYSPKVGNIPGRVIPITTPVRPGLPEAAERLATLRYRAADADRAGSDCLAAR